MPAGRYLVANVFCYLKRQNKFNWRTPFQYYSLKSPAPIVFSLLLLGGLLDGNGKCSPNP
jgi:hypothetical protein